MPARDPDIVVIGSGPNGLVAACLLARSGFGVLVLEADPKRPGGGVKSEALTLPSFVHDVGAGFFPFARTSPAFAELNLEAKGVVWQYADFQTCHLASDGSRACIARDHDLAARHFGSARDGDAWRRLASWHGGLEADLLELLWRPSPSFESLRRLGLRNAIKLARLFARRGRSLARRWFSGKAARGVLPGLALGLGVGPDQPKGAGFGYLLGLAATTGGFAVARGGAQSVTDALITLLEGHGGRLRLGAHASRIVVREGRVVGVQLDDGTEIVVTRGVVVDANALSLWRDLRQRNLMPAVQLHRLQRFGQGPSTFRVDWALSARVPWSVEEAQRSAVVHTAADLDSLARSFRQAREGKLPDELCLVVGQPSLVDPCRAPQNQHTLACSLRVPTWSRAQWEQNREPLATRIEERIEQLAPGFRRSILGRHVSAPPEHEAGSDALLGGVNTGGATVWRRGVARRLLSPGSDYRTPVKGLYLCSSATHPGPGVHGMCGHNAARIALRDLG